MTEETLFTDALEIADPGERAAFLDRACAGNPALRGRLDRLLARHTQAGGFLGHPAALPTPRPLDTPGDDSTYPRSHGPHDGGVIGPYKLVEVIGEGGMGTVWLAQQTEPVKRLVALKVIRAGMDSRSVLARFEQERQALALMDHPNIAKVLDGGVWSGARGQGTGVRPDGERQPDSSLHPDPWPLTPAPYFVMELVKGIPITKFCDERRLTPRERLELFVPVCQAVQHAHQKGVIHRDIKPSNVLVALYDGRPVPKVIDFGIAKAAGQPLTEKTLVTGLGTVVGTPEYMSPEQAELNQLDIDTRSDVYSLGVLLYELLTGTTPLHRKRVKEAALLEVLRLVREEEPPRPSTRLSTTDELPSIAANRGVEPKKLTGLVRGELDWIVMKALEKDRSRRYETANGFALDVQRYLADEPVQACPPSAGYRLSKFARRNRGRLAVAAGVFLAATVAAASIGWAVRDRVARRAEAAQAETARRVKVEGQVRDSLHTARTLIDENKLAPARAKLAEAVAQFGTDGPALGELAAEVEASAAELDRFQQFLDLIDQAHQAETAPLEITLVADDSSGLAGTSTSARAAERRPAAAVPFLLTALQQYCVLDGDKWNGTLEGGLLGRQQVEQIRRAVYEELLWLTDDILRRRQGHRSDGPLSEDAAGRQALAYLGKAEAAHRPTPAFYALRARCHTAMGDGAAARSDARLADQTPPTLALDHAFRGQAAYDAGQLAEGVEAFEAALRMEPTHYWSLMKLGYCLSDLGRGPDEFTGAVRVYTGCLLKRPDHAHAYYCRGYANMKLRRYELAVADHTRAIELNPQVGFAWNNRGVAYIKLGQPAKAVADCSRAIELNPKHANAWNCRGVASSKLGQTEQAVADYSRAVELNPKLTEAWYNRGVAYSKLNQPAKAVADFSRAVEIDPKNADAWYNRGNAHGKLNQPGKAVADFSRALELNPTFADIWTNRGNAYLRMGQPEKAVADYSQAVELDPKHKLAWYCRGVAHSRLGRPEKAVADYSKAIELDPKYANAWNNRGSVHLRLGQPEKAVADCARAVDLMPALGNGWSNLGKAHYRTGDAKEAVVALNKALDLRPGREGDEWFFLAMALRQLGQPDEARKAYERAIRWAEKNPDVVAKNAEQADDFRRLRAEVEEVLELKTK
jgi:tetratricopeptide (TPR) repeat protein